MCVLYINTPNIEKKIQMTKKERVIKKRNITNVG